MPLSQGLHSTGGSPRPRDPASQGPHVPGTPHPRYPTFQGPHVPGTPWPREPTSEGPHVPGTPRPGEPTSVLLSPSLLGPEFFLQTCLPLGLLLDLWTQFSCLHESSSLPAFLAARSPKHSWEVTTLRGIHVTRCQWLPSPDTKQTQELWATGKPHGHGCRCPVSSELPGA